ncbi:uncharacterized protein LOC135813122 [Sycon ciliatum]|uniref:uncharacterized protein LOC135813122 n=1 Tax=Sycon ciliatum TaxID=27933 RepID=UPI0031F718B4
MESIINRGLSNFPEKNSILSSRQFGFRAGLDTSDLLIAFQHAWYQIAAQGGLVRVLAVDIAGAFDKVSHPGVLHKADQYGVKGSLLCWLQSYLTSPKIKVVVGGQASTPRDITGATGQHPRPNALPDLHLRR